MGTYLQQYGAGDERRNRIVKSIVIGCLIAAILGIVAYFLLQNFTEKQRVKRFLAEINSKRFEDAYRDWGCTDAHPCRDYNYPRFLQDWGPQKNVTSHWDIASTDGCKGFVTVNVQAKGAELQSLMVARDTGELGFAPAPECQERKWRFSQFFRRVFHLGS